MEDLTWEERLITKEWFQKANERNKKEESKDIKLFVRGTKQNRIQRD